MDPLVVVVFERVRYGYLRLLIVLEVSRPQILLLQVLWNDSTCPFCSGMFAKMYSTFIPSVFIDSLDALLLY